MIVIWLYQKWTILTSPTRYLQHFHLDYYLTEALRSCDSVEQLQHFFQAPSWFRDARWVDIQPIGLQITMIFKGTLSWGAVIEKHSIIMLRSQCFLWFYQWNSYPRSDIMIILCLLFYAAGIIFARFYASYSDVEGFYCTCHVNLADHT